MTATKLEPEISLPVSREHATEGYRTDEGWTHFRPVIVTPDDTVLAWDPVGESYSQHHDLSADEQAEAIRLAELVRAGTHTVVAGLVRRRART